MPNRLAAVLCVVALAVWVEGCAPSRTYREGVLATQYRSLSTQDMRSYASRLDEEIAQVERGGPVPAGATREEYLKDLRLTRYGVQREISARDIQLQDERRQQLERERPFPVP
jgi:hypothetical protein